MTKKEFGAWGKSDQALLQRVDIQNFKAFKKLSLELKGRHLLVYGANGAGKSSLYWALYTFLQSARKSTEDVSKYFDPQNPERLLNIHANAEESPGEISVALGDGSGADSVYRIGRDLHETNQRPVVLKGNLASDFITYRFFFGFSDFKNSEKFNVWPLFEQEILPFCVSVGGQSPMELWEKVRSGDANPDSLDGPGGAKAYRDFKEDVERFSGILPGIVDSISTEAQKFYDAHFATNDPAPLLLKLGVTTLPAFEGTNRHNSKFTHPVVEFQIKSGTQVITRPQAFLNEAKLTQLALSIRFAASMVNLHDSALKLLVLDDLLVSLDMSNRMKVVEILLSETFSGYQKIILTHDFGLFQEFRRKVGAMHRDWSFVRLQGTPATAISCSPVKSEIQKAEEHLHGYNLDEAALNLRKAAEATAKRFVDQNDVVPTKDFVSLTEALRAARNKVLNELPVHLYKQALESTPQEHRHYLLPADNSDLDAIETLDAKTRGILSCQRGRLRRVIEGEHIDYLQRVKIIDEVLACTERVLNPAAHAGCSPLYEAEVEKALELIKQLDSALNEESS